MKKLILFLSIFFIVIFSNCGTRKSETAKTETKKDSLIFENHYSQATKIVLMDIFTAKPIDALRPMWIDGKRYENATVTNDKSKSYSKSFDIYKKYNIYRTHEIAKTKVVTSVKHDLLYLGMFITVIVAAWAWFKF